MIVNEVKTVGNERASIREELSKMTFEELQKLKEELGAKLYNEAMFGTKQMKQTTFKRENKNRPREMSSKKPDFKIQTVAPIKKIVARDPRFESMCGTYDEKLFKSSYSFLKDIKKKEKQELKEQLAQETNPNRKEQINYLLQRMTNQDREEERLKKLQEKIHEKRKKCIEMLNQGEKPVFYKSSERRVVDLVDQFEDLKKTGKLVKHIEKHRKKSKQKDRKKMASQ